MLTTMAQMAQFSFPYYFTIPNSEFRIPKFVEQTERLTILIHFNSANVSELNQSSYRLRFKEGMAGTW